MARLCPPFHPPRTPVDVSDSTPRLSRLRSTGPLTACPLPPAAARRPATRNLISVGHYNRTVRWYRIAPRRSGYSACSSGVYLPRGRLFFSLPCFSPTLRIRTLRSKAKLRHVKTAAAAADAKLRLHRKGDSCAAYNISTLLVHVDGGKSQFLPLAFGPTGTTEIRLHKSSRRSISTPPDENR